MNLLSLLFLLISLIVISSASPPPPSPPPVKPPSKPSLQKMSPEIISKIGDHLPLKDLLKVEQVLPQKVPPLTNLQVKRRAIDPDDISAAILQGKNQELQQKFLAALDQTKLKNGEYSPKLLDDAMALGSKEIKRLLESGVPFTSSQLSAAFYSALKGMKLNNVRELSKYFEFGFKEPVYTSPLLANAANIKDLVSGSPFSKLVWDALTRKIGVLSYLKHPEFHKAFLRNSALLGATYLGTGVYKGSGYRKIPYRSPSSASSGHDQKITNYP